MLLLPAAVRAQSGPADPAADPIAECSSEPDVPVNVTEIFPDPVYNFDTPLAGIQQLASDSRHSIHEMLTLGLTRYQPVLGFQVPIKGIQFPNGFACAHIDHVDVTIGYQDVTVYIADEIPRPGCGFDEIMGHEQKHIAVNRDILAEYAPLIQSRIKAYVQQNGTFREAQPDAAIQHLHDQLQAILNHVAEQMVNDNSHRQQLVDSPQEYRRVSMSCSGQLQVIANRYFRGQR